MKTRKKERKKQTNKQRKKQTNKQTKKELIYIEYFLNIMIIFNYYTLYYILSTFRVKNIWNKTILKNRPVYFLTISPYYSY